MNGKKFLLATSAFGLAAAGLGGVALAQESSQPAERAAGVGEIVVTAEKREQSLQEVPVAISAYTAERRDLIGIQTVQDMTNFTPGLQYSGQLDRIYLRGIGRTTNVQTADPGVATYSDGIYTSSTVEAGRSPIFVDRVEVLRGPQGTLYGRNSIGGAINVISRRPTNDFYAEIRGRYENFEHSLIEGAISGPLGENIKARLAANWEKQNQGWFDNVVPGHPDQGNVIDQFYGEGQLAIDFTPKFDVWIKFAAANWGNGSGGPGSRQSYTPFTGTPSGYNTTAFNSASQFFGAGFSFSGVPTNVVNNGPALNPANADPWKIAVDTDEKISLDDTYIINSQWTYHFDGVDLKYVTGGTNYHYSLLQDNDGTAVDSYKLPLRATALCNFVPGCTGLTIRPQAYSLYEEYKKWWSHEINLSSTGGGPLQWILGAYYYDEKYRQPVSVTFVNQNQWATPTAGAAPNPLNRSYDTRNNSEDKSYAGFGQVDWSLTDTLKTTIGLRYSHDHKTSTESARLLCFALPACGTDPFSLGTLTPAVDITAFVVGSGKDAGGNLLPGVSKATVINPATGFATRSLDKSWGATTGTFGLEWQPDNDTLVYGKYSRGYKAGGFNVGITSALVGSPLTDPEHSDDYELGLKKTWFERLQTNAAIFYNKYEDLQVPVTIVNNTGAIGVNQSVFFNVPESVSKGFELEATWEPIDKLQFILSYGYLDAKITKGCCIIDPADPTASQPTAAPSGPPSAVDVATGLPQQGQNLKGNHLINSAPNKVTVNVNYTWDFEAGSLTPSLTYTWRDKQYGFIFDRSYYQSPTWDQIDARVTFKDAKDHYSIILYGRNLGDTLGYTGGSPAARVSGTTYGAAPTYVSSPLNVQGIASTYPLTPPRTYGIELQYRF
jgi:iron complex outermembrane receptor protein